MQPANPVVTQNFLITPGSNVQQGDPDYLLMIRLSKDQLRQRWETPEGENIISRWKSSDFNRSTVDSLVGKIYDRTDLRGIKLISEDISGADLSLIEFFAANLEGTNFSNVNLTDSYLSEANIKGTNFSWAKMDGVYLANVDFNTRTAFKGVNLNRINFTFATILQDLILSQTRIVELERKRPVTAFLLRVSCDYGRSFTRFFSWCLAFVVIFAVAYASIPELIGRLQTSSNSFIRVDFWDSLYFSAMTFITLGTDILPRSSLGKFLILLEGSIGYLMTGLLVAILVKKTVGE